MGDDFPIIEKTFAFRCTQCADCCTGDQTVFLNLFDLYKMAQYLRLNHTALLFSKKIVALKKDTQNDVYRPVIRFKSRPFKFCPFLINEWGENGKITGWCRLHPRHKPLVCSLAPVGVRFDAAEDSLQFLLVPPTDRCPGLKEAPVQILEEYLAPYQQEIAFQNLFFKVLECVKSNGWSAAQFQHNLYAFSLQKPFAETLEDILRVHCGTDRIS
ncbi:YkgJ family cysteine cluster protein [Caldithrix abyssi]